MTQAFISSRRFGLIALAVLLFLACLLGRLFYLHVWDQDRLLRFVERNRQKFEIIYGRRGCIVDRRGNLLAATRPVIDLGVDPQSLDPKDEGKLPHLAKLLNLPESELRARLNQKVREVDGPDGHEVRLVRWLKICEGLDEVTYQRAMALNVKGIYGNRRFERTYPSGTLAAHVLGYTNKEEQPAMGIEKAMDFYLRSQLGWRESEKDGRRREMAQFRTREVPPADGLNVELSLDLAIQHMAEKELQRIAADYNPQSASIIVSDPSTGFILAMANYPTFDPNRYGEGPMENQRNRALTDVFEPGSTFKIVPASAAINENLTRPDDRFDCGNPVLRYEGREIKLPAEHEHMGILSVREIVAKSSNRGAAQLGAKLGSDRLYKYAHDFGFGKRTGLILGSEVDGVLHPVKRWDGLTISRLPMGHAVSATAMQVHQAMSIVANGGVLMQPQLVRRVYDDSNATVVSFYPQAKRRVINAQTAETMRELLVGVVGPEGTAKRAGIEGFEVAGKTGTTQKLIDGRYSSAHHVASFVGFFPARNPRILITVIVDDARPTRGLAYGGIVAAPAFHNVAEQIIGYLGIRPEHETKTMLAWKGGAP